MKLISLFGLGCSALVVFAACGGDDSSVSAGAAFCGDWAKAQCRKLAACPIEGEPAISQSDCVKSYSKLCSDPPPSGVTFDVNCSGKNNVNQQAKSACLAAIDSASCEAFDAADFGGACDNVCTSGGQGATGGNGNTGGGSGNGTGGNGNTGGSLGTGTGGNVTTGGSSGNSGAVAACTTVLSAVCDFLYRCVPAGQRDANFQSQFGTSVAECKSSYAAMCVSETLDCPTLNATSANTCSDALSALACTSIDSFPPSECDLAFCN